MTLAPPRRDDDDEDSDADAVERLTPGSERRLLLICEHASQRLPERWVWPEEDRWLIGTHWAIDLGAAELTRALARALGCPAILARFSRLLVDPNRPEDSPTLFRDEAEGRPVALNHRLDDDERERRLAGYYRPYHRAIDQALAAAPEASIFSVHSFTPIYEGRPRAVELGILYDRHRELAARFADALTEAAAEHAPGLHIAHNEPYSGILGFAYSPERHGAAHGRRCLEIEVRQDLALDRARRPALLAILVAALRAALLDERRPLRRGP
ncbi:MAG: N-formylglutamate amidohydrolase [Nannocystaceae bacterium]